MRVQVEPSHYSFESYDSLQRWSSYWYQIRAALDLQPRSCLEIGSGTGVFYDYLQRLGIEMRSLDLDPSRRPDYVGSVTELDKALPPGKTFDLVCAFQVLEHLPWDVFDACLKGIARRAKPHALIPLPHHGFQARFSAAFGGLKLSAGVKVPKPWRFKPTDQHHWELDFGRRTPRQVTKAIERHFRVLDRYFVKENPYHYFWVLESK